MSTAPRITWINHASYLLEVDEVGLIVDPWLDGTVFDNGWSLYSPTILDDSLIDRVTHIWISHEHPDHFHIPSLRRLGATDPSRITVLYQRTRDRRVLEFCENLGFATVEMEPHDWLELTPGLQVMCNPWWNADSYLAARTADGIILNLNDCVVTTERASEAILVDVGERPHVLITQFSYANRVGNPEDVEARREAAALTLEHVRSQIEVFRPDVVIPSASFVWFSHVENNYMNDSVNSVRTAVETIEACPGVRPLVLYSGESWLLADSPPDSASSIRKYVDDLGRVLSGPPVAATEQPVPIDVLQRLGDDFAADLADANSRFGIWLLTRLNRLRTVRVWLTDLQMAVTVDPKGLRVVDVDPSRTDVAMASTSLAFVLKNRFGGSTVLVNARVTMPAGGEPRRFFNVVELRDANNADSGVSGMVMHRLVRRAERSLPPASRLARSARMWRPRPRRR